jgi:hypothetical protein
MHPAIGMLNNGQFYAYLHGYDNEPTYRDNAAALEALLRGEPEPQPVVEPEISPADQEGGDAASKALSGQYQTYNVTLTFQYPAWDQHAGIRYPDIVAKNKSSANAIARNRARDDGHLCGGQGRATFTAKDAEL